MKAALVHRGPDAGAFFCDEHIELGCQRHRHSLFKGIQKLPAGTSLYWERGVIRLGRYCDLRFTDKLRRSEREIEDGLDALLQDTVRRHLLSDLRVGAFLSGGIDSSLMSAMMAKASDAPVPVFSIGVKEQGFDELPYARRVAARYGMEALERVVEADLVRLIPAIVHHIYFRLYKADVRLFDLRFHIANDRSYAQDA